MLNVTNATKQAWASETSQKDITILILGEGLIHADSIKAGSFTYTESIMSSDTFEAVGCVAKKLEFETDGYNRPVLKNKLIYATIKADDTENINVFAGYVDEGRKQSRKGLKKITAYDMFYNLSRIDVTDWWNNLGETTLLGSLQNFALTYHFGIATGIDLINADLPCFGGTKRQIKKLSGLDFLKHLCQINGCFGFFNGTGLFDVKYIATRTQHKLYPSQTLFPSPTIFPSNTESDGSFMTTTIDYYKELKYEDYSVKPIDNVIIRNTSKDYGVQYYGGGKNTYIIQGNIFAFDQEYEDIRRAMLNIFNKISKVSFRPFSAEHNAYPWLECGDTVVYNDIDDNGDPIEVELLVMERTMSGDQMMWDKFSAKGEEDQYKIFDLKAQLEDIQNQIDKQTEEEQDDNS